MTSQLKNLVTTKVNTEIWAKLLTKTRSISRDTSLQKVQARFLKGLMPITQVIKHLLNTDRPIMKSFGHLLTPNVSLLSQANHELNQWRRELIKPDLNEKYQQSSAEHVPCKWQLFDDLHDNKTLQEITTTNRVSQKVSDNYSHNKRYRSMVKENNGGCW